MKNLAFLVALAVFLQSTNAGVIEVIAECRAISKASDSDMDTFMSHKLPTTKEGKCMMACIMKKTNMMTADGKISPEGMKGGVQDMSQKYNVDKDKVDKAVKLIDTCANDVPAGTNECEAAYKFSSCFMEKGKEVGLEPPHGRRR